MHCHICKRHLQKGGIWCVICTAANFITMRSPAYSAPPRTLQKCSTPPTDQQAQPPSQHRRQHPKQTYCPTQHNLIHRPKQKKCEVKEEAKQFEQFDKIMSTGKTSVAIGCP